MMRTMLKPFTGGVLALAMLLTGCASGPSSGGGTGGQNQQAPASAQNASVTVVGEVARHVIPWQDGLTLMQAFVMSGYQAASNPAKLGIIRKKQMPIYIEYQKLYDGQDMLLEPGDRIEIQP